MNSVEKRHSSRRRSGGGRRKHSDGGGRSDASSGGGSFLDETDREVSNLTDRAFRSLCVGDEAVYNDDADVPASSPSVHTATGRQRAFCQSGQDSWDHEEMKRAAQESYGLQVQQYGQQYEWTPGDPQTQQGDDLRWPGNADGRTGGWGSVTFQHAALMDGSLHQSALDKEPLPLHSNGAAESGTQERRSRSRVSSLIRAFNSDGCRDGAGLDGHLKESNNEANWDKSALMTIQQELTELSTAYGQNLSAGPYSPPGQYSSQESFYSSQVATAHMDSSSSFMRSSHSQHSMSSLYSPSSTFFIHSEYSPFRVWRAQDRFPFQRGDVSGYTQSSHFQEWYETPTYTELSLGPETHRVPAHEQWGADPPQRKPLEHVALPHAPRSSSTSTVLQKASSTVQKRCESELAEFHNVRKRTRSLGNNRLPSQRPSTVSPTKEMSRRRGRRATLNSINDLQHKFKMMTSEHSVAAEMMMGNQHANDGFIQSTNSDTATIMAGEQVAHSNTCTAALSHLHTAGSYSQQDARTSEVHQDACSPPAIEHAPVRAESRGATPDIRLSSSYKTRATSLLFNLKDNRKRVKSTYSPPKFKCPENLDRNNQVIRNDGAEPRDTVINIPEFQDHSDLQVPQVVVQQRPSLEPHVASHHPFTGYHSPGVTAFNPHLTAGYGVQRNDYISGDHLAPPMQSEMFLHTGFNSYSQDTYTSNPLTHGYIQQQEDVPSFANNMHENNMSTSGTLVGHSYRQENANKLSISHTVNMAPAPQPETIYSTTKVPGLHVDYNNQTAYQMNTAAAQQYYHESMSGEMMHGDRYERVKDNRYAFADLSSHESWEHHCREQEIPFMDDQPNPRWEGEAPVLTGNYPNAQFYQSMDVLPDILFPPPQEYASNNDSNMNMNMNMSTQAQDNPEYDESKAEGCPVYPQNTPYHHQVRQYSACSTQAIPGGTAANEKQLPEALQEYGLQDNQQYGIMENQSTQKYSQIRSTEQEHAKQESYDRDDGHNYMLTQESTQQIQQDVQGLEADRKQCQQDSVKQQFELNFKEKPLIADKIHCKANTPFLANQEQDKLYANVNDKLVLGGEVKEKPQIQTELSKKLEWAQTLQTKLESVRSGLMEETVACGATGTQKEGSTTEGMSVSGSGGQPHVEQTITNKLDAVHTSEETHIKQADDTQVRAPQAEGEKDQGIKSQRNKDESTTVELKEGSACGEAQVEVAPEECVETIGISPDGKAKGGVLASREPGEEQAKEGQMEQIAAGVIKTKQSEQVQIDAGAPVEHIKAQLSKTATEKTKLPKMEGTKAVHIKVEDDIKEEGKDEPLRAGKINAEPSKVEKVNDPLRTKQSQTEKAKVNREEKAKEEDLNEVVTARDEQNHAEEGQAVKPEKCPTAPPRIEHAKMGHAKAKREQAEKRMDHSIVSLLIQKAEKEKLKQEPDKVEKAKTELGKAKAELAKIKEKMTEEQKENQTNSSELKAVDKNVLQKEKSPPPYQQTEETPVRSPVDEYERVREKYGFSQITLTNKKQHSANGVTSPSQDIDRPAPHSDKSEEASDDNKPRDEEHCQSKAATKEEEEKPIAKNEEISENHYVYSESSKEFKLSNPNESSSSLVTKARDSEIHIGGTCKDKVINTKPEPVRAHIDVTSQPVVSKMNPTKCHIHERKANQIKDTHSAPPRAPIHKERAQTKQEILTSKIKAHAEKEISAIKEKHFGSGKSVPQRLHEVTKPLDKNIPSNIAPRDQQATVQLKNSIPANIVATPPVMSSNAATTMLITDSQVQKQEPIKSVKDTLKQQHGQVQKQEPLKSVKDTLKQQPGQVQKQEHLKSVKDTLKQQPGQVQKQEPLKSVKDMVKQQPVELNQTTKNDNRNEELKQREKKPGTKAASEIKEQNTIGLGKEELIKGNSSRQTAEDINVPQMTKADPPPSKPEENYQQETNQTERPEDAPSLKLVFSQNEVPAAAEDDSLQIMGIMVTVRARTETVSVDDEDGGAKKEAPEKAEIDSQTKDNIKPSANLCVEMRKESVAPDSSNGRAEELSPLASPPTVGTEHTKVGAQNHLENEPEESTHRLENKTADLTDKRLTTQKESSGMRKTSQSHAVHREDPVALQEDSSMGMKPAPNKAAKTQPILFKQGKITEKAKISTNKNKNGNEAKSNITVNVEVGNDPSLAKAMETGINSLTSPVKSDIRSSKIQSHTASEKYQMADHVTLANMDQVQDGGSVPLLVDKRTHPSLPEVDQQKKNSTSPDLKGHENVHISKGKVQGTRTHSGENSQDGGNVHIGCIAIRVVEQHNQEKAVKELVPLKSVAETMNTEREEDRAIPLTPAMKPLKQMNENVVQQVHHMPHEDFSSGSSNLNNKITDSSETTQNEDETHQQSNIAKATADDANNTKIQATEEDYFQFQGLTEINHEQNNTKLDGAGKPSLTKELTEELGVPRTTTSVDVADKVSVNTELSSQQEAKQVTNKDKVLDNARKTTIKSDSATSENRSTSGKSEQDSKNIHMLPERQSESNQRVNIETGEDIQKQATQNTFHVSGKERQTTRNSAVGASKEQPNFKQEAKSKPRVSTVPEISAIADYARLKVIAADDGRDTMQDFPPNKKEGFFPMIQSRLSRRPVFTEETPERRTVSKKTEKSKEPELSHKINKEPKSLVLSSMEQDHKRTGMFKLREKDNVLSDVKTKEAKVDAEKIQDTQDNKVASQGTSADFTYWSQDAATIAEPTAISSANINQINTSSSQYLEQPNNSTTLERPEGGEPFTKQRTLPKKVISSQQQVMHGEMFTREQSKGEQSNVITSEEKSKENEEETTAKQRRENAIIQQINEERRATLEIQKREERRAMEREARAARLEEERRVKQREADKKAEEERTAQLLREKAAQEELEKKRQELEEQRAAEEERMQKMREEERRKKETEERIAAQIQEEIRRAKQREEEARAAKEVEDKRRDKRREDRRVAQIQEERRAAQVEEERREREEQEERTKREEEERRMAKHREIEQRIKEHEEMRAAELEQERMKRRQEEAHRPEESREEQMLPAPTEADQSLHTAEHEEQQPSQKVELEEQQTPQKLELEEQQTAQKVELEEEPTPQKVAQRKAALLMDALQYYAITSSADPKDKHPRSPVSRQRRVKPTKQESTPDDSLSRPLAPPSPAPVLPRSATSSPAPGPKPAMFRVKDNTFRISSLTKSVKPRLHKSFGEDFRVGSPHRDWRGSDIAEEEQDRARRSAGTPIHQDTVTRSNRLPSVNETQELPPQPPPPPFVPESPAARAEYRPCSRRSMPPDEEDSRSSNMSEDVESFATSAGDLADFRGFGDHDRPESACSYSSDVARSLGRPPSVPLKTDKALKRAQRLTTRRIKKELTKTSEAGPGPEEKPLHAASSGGSSSGASELRSSYRHARASPHFSAPFSLCHAPASASSAASSRAEMPAASRYSRASPHAIGSVAFPHATGPVITPHAIIPVSIPVTSPHATGPISLPIASPHGTAPVSLPIPSPHHPPPASLPVGNKTIASTPSSPVLRRRTNPPGPVTQYHVEPGYTQSYPLTQPKVLQDPESGQYYVVDMPVQVKTKTFFDPETGKYVQLNVRQSTQSGFQPQPQHAGYPQPRIPQAQLHVQSPPQVYPQVATLGKSFVMYPGYPPGPQPTPVSTLPAQRSYSGMSIPDTLPQPPQNYTYHGDNSEETPYMDTAYKTNTIHGTNKVNHRTAGPQDKYPDTNRQLQNSTSAESSLQQRDIITISELEDFMDVSDW